MAVLAVSMTAQKLPKSVKDAKKALNAKNYTESLQLINTALEDNTVAGMSEAWSVKGDIFAGMISDEADKLIKSNSGIPGVEKFQPTEATNGVKAFDAYKMALSKSSEGDKGSKASIKGLVGLVTSLNHMGLGLFNGGKFGEAFNAFNTILSARELLNGVGNKSILSKPEEFNLMQYYAALSATNAGQADKATGLFKSLVDAGYENHLPYQQMFKNMVGEDEKGAFEILEKGKKVCGDDPDAKKGFLFTEINHYLKKGEYKTLETKIQDAIAAEPDNVSLYFALGTVYDQLYQGAIKDGKNDDADKYFNEAKSYYEKTAELDNSHSDAHYNIGAMHYNKATFLNTEIKKYDDDMSSAGIKKWESLKNQQKGYLSDSKPFFEKALSLNPKHVGAMTALKGIAAYNNDKTTVDKYQKMIDALGK